MPDYSITRIPILSQESGVESVSWVKVVLYSSLQALKHFHPEDNDDPSLISAKKKVRQN